MRLLSILTFLLIFSSCASEVESIDVKTPDNLLSREQFKEVLIDVQLVEGARNRGLLTNKDTIPDLVKGYAKVLKKHNISKLDLEQNIRYYYDFSGQMEEIYSEVLNELIQMEAELNNSKIDSIE